MMHICFVVTAHILALDTLIILNFIVVCDISKSQTEVLYKMINNWKLYQNIYYLLWCIYYTKIQIGIIIIQKVVISFSISVFWYIEIWLYQIMNPAYMPHFSLDIDLVCSKNSFILIEYNHNIFQLHKFQVANKHFYPGIIWIMSLKFIPHIFLVFCFHVDLRICLVYICLA